MTLAQIAFLALLGWLCLPLMLKELTLRRESRRRRKTTYPKERL